MYLKIKVLKGYDHYYYKLNEEDNTWRDVLYYIELALDSRYDDINKMVGVKLDMEIVADIPEDVEVE